MPIAKRPDRDSDAAREFIDGAEKKKPKPKPKRIITTVNIEAGVLERIDLAAKKHGGTRSQFITLAASKMADEILGERP